jgi:uncharacterized protein (TIGR03067 family)
MTSGNPSPSPPPIGEGFDLPPSSQLGKGAARGVGLRVAAVVVLLAVGGAAVWYFLLRDSGPANDLQRFQGEWKYCTPNRPDVTFVRIEADRWTFISNGVEARAYRMTLVESTKPKQIDLDLIDVEGLRGTIPKLHGIYEFDGDITVRIRTDPGDDPRPTTLDDTDRVRVMTKVKLDRKPQPGK